MLRVLVCVSGGGTNLQALIDGTHNGTITNARIVRVISNKIIVQFVFKYTLIINQYLCRLSAFNLS